MKFVIQFLLIYFVFNPLNILAANNAELKIYVDKLIHEGYQIVQNKQLSDEQKFKKSSEIIRKNLRLDWMAKYSLGRNRLSLPKNKIKEFVDIYSKFVVNAYADLSSHYNGEKVILKSIKPIDEKMFLINMEIGQMGSATPFKVDYLIHELKPHEYKVADVITEGVSILNSQKAEFNSVILSQGIDVLINDLKEKVARRELKSKSNP